MGSKHHSFNKKSNKINVTELSEALYFKFDYLRNKIINIILISAFECNLSLFGGAVRSMILKEAPNDLDLSYSNTINKDSFLVKISSFFDISKQETPYNILMSESYILKSKIVDELSIKIDLVPENMLGVDQDFDVNALKMTDLQTIKIVPNQKNLDIFDVISNIKNKKFTLLKTFGFCPVRTGSTIIDNSKYVVNYLKIQLRTAKMIENGWQCNNFSNNLSLEYNNIKDYEQIFNPLLFAENKHIDTCTICMCIPKNKYILEVKCCKKPFCLTCILDYVKERFNNSEISCPNCRGDPFNLKTVNMNKYTDTIIQQPNNYDIYEIQEYGQPLG